MLSRIEIESEFYKLKKYTSNRNLFVNTKNKSLTYLIDSNHRIRGISFNPMSCKSLATFNKEAIPFLFTATLSDQIDLEILQDECWKYKLNTGKTKWEENLLIYSKEEIYDLVLTNEKCILFDDIHYRIDYSRKIFVKSLEEQNFVYFSKYLEAKEILQNNILEDIELKYPYTTGYANVMGLTLQQSAKAIVLQHESLSGFLSESENLRLKYKKIILEETDLSKLRSHYENFVTENERYGNL